MLDKIKTILQNSPVINDQVNFIGIESIPQGVKPPYIVLGLVDGEVATTKNTVSKMDNNIMSIDTFSDTLYTEDGAIGAYLLQRLIEEVLDTYSGTVDGTTLYIERQGTIRTYELNAPNNFIKNAECEYRVYETKDTPETFDIRVAGGDTRIAGGDTRVNDV